MGPRVLTVFFIQLVFIATDNIASWLAPGAVSALVYGWLFMQVPETLVGTAIGTVLLPTISEQVAREQMDTFRQSLNRAMRIILALTIPAAVLVAVGIRPVVGLLGFDAAGTEVVVWVTRGYLVGLMGFSLIEVASRAFYAQQNAMIPLGANFIDHGDLCHLGNRVGLCTWVLPGLPSPMVWRIPVKRCCCGICSTGVFPEWWMCAVLSSA